MQLVMYQMLTTNNSSFRNRSVDESIGTNYHHTLLKNHQKPLKRLTYKRQSLAKNITTSK
jgi:hypothetical protein